MLQTLIGKWLTGWKIFLGLGDEMQSASIRNSDLASKPCGWRLDILKRNSEVGLMDHSELAKNTTGPR